MKKFNHIKNTKGASSIEFVISLFVFIMLFSFMFDLFLLAYKQYSVSKEANSIIRILSIQSGTLPSTPLNFPGGNNNYLTTIEMNNRIKDKFNGIGITDYTVKVKAEDKSLPSGERVMTLPSLVGIKTDYRDYIKLEITYNYKWGLWSQFIPGDLEGKMNVSRTGFSEYKFDNTDWDGEK